MNDFIRQLMKDKEGNYSLREAVTLVFVAATLVSWLAQQFFAVAVPEYMFYSFVSIIGAGCFGYSIEKKAKQNINETKNEQP